MVLISLFEFLKQFLPLIYIILTAGLILCFLKNKIKKLIKPVVIFVLILEFSKMFLGIFNTFYLWRNSPISKFLLPPHKEIGYFLSYSGFRFALPFLISLLLALLIFKFVVFLNKDRERKFFYNDEPWHIFLTILILGYPLWIIYLFSVIFLGIVIFVFKNIFNSKEKIFSLYYLWLPLCLIFIFLSKWLMNLHFIFQFRIL
jgi:hypothetical protein